MLINKLVRQLNNAGTLLKEIVYPRKCAVCKQQIDEGVFCNACRNSYMIRKRVAFSPEAKIIPGLPYAPGDVLSGAVFLFRYDGVIKDILHKIKFEDRAEFLIALKEETDIALPENLDLWLDGFDLITSVPTSKERLARRGFDVPEEIFANIVTSKKYKPNLIARVRNTLPLFELAPDARRAELQGCFVLKQGVSVKGLRILLCDDIYTSGSTLAEIAACLMHAGAKSVHALAFSAARENWNL